MQPLQSTSRRSPAEDTGGSVRGNRPGDGFLSPILRRPALFNPPAALITYLHADRRYQGRSGQRTQKFACATVATLIHFDIDSYTAGKNLDLTLPKEPALPALLFVSSAT
jgi:hypothetical protein